jgi:hypothetical protein
MNFENWLRTWGATFKIHSIFPSPATPADVSRRFSMKPHLAYFTLLLVAVFVLTAFAASARAQTFTVLCNFTGSSGAYPYGGLMQDSAGSIYGTTYSGGAFFGRNDIRSAIRRGARPA